MENCLKITNKAFLCLGFDIFGNYQNKPNILAILSVTKYLNLMVMALFFVLMWVHNFNEAVTFINLTNVLQGVHGVQCLVKFLVLLFNVDKIGQLVKTLVKCHQTNFRNKFDNSKFFTLIPRFLMSLGALNFAIVCLVQFLHFLIIIVSLVVNKSPTVKPLMINLAFTFNSCDHFLFVYI